jgi:branched-chain amino acid transport system substrate-binding protein
MVANGGGDIINGRQAGGRVRPDEEGRARQRAARAVPRHHGIGLKIAQGCLISSPFYYDMTPEARAFTDRFTKEIGRPPSFIQAGTYGAVLHYLKAVQAAGTDEAKA